MSGNFRSRAVSKRIFIEGDLVLTSPAHFGGGEQGQGADMVLALDMLEEKPVIWGTSLAGALRAYLFNFLYGYINEEKTYCKEANQEDSIINQLFGFQLGDKGGQSWLLFSDAISNDRVFEKRDMVDIDPVTNTAVDEHKFDAQLIAAGTRFTIKLELHIPRTMPANQEDLSFEEATAIALHGLESGQINLGAKKQRGWGACCVEGWRVRTYNCDELVGLFDWLADEYAQPFEYLSITDALDVDASVIKNDKRDNCSITAYVHLISPILIGSTSEAVNDPDNEQLARRRVDGNDVIDEPVISGTALAGVLRNQCLRILETLDYSKDEAQQFQESLWGFVRENAGESEETAFRSRVRVSEIPLTDCFERIQSRIRINHFTGGTYPGALFEGSILIPRGLDGSAFEKGTNSVLRIDIENPQEKEVGLLLLALGDLFTQAANLGSGYAIGRGYMTAQKIIVNWEAHGTDIEIRRADDQNDLFTEDYALVCTDGERVRDYIKAATREGEEHA